MPRTTTTEVRQVIEIPEDVDVDGFIRTASAFTGWILSKDTEGVLNDALALEIETYLAAHFYAIRDPQYQSKSTAGASATYQGQTGMGLDLTWWGQQAKLLDITGTLSEQDAVDELVQNPGLFGLYWLGKLRSEQVSYEDRNGPPTF